MATWSKNELATAMGTKQQDSSRAHELGTVPPVSHLAKDCYSTSAHMGRAAHLECSKM